MIDAHTSGRRGCHGEGDRWALAGGGPQAVEVAATVFLQTTRRAFTQTFVVLFDIEVLMLLCDAVVAAEWFFSMLYKMTQHICAESDMLTLSRDA